MSNDRSASEGNRVIYFDNHATTPVDPQVAATFSNYVRNVYGNPHSVDHSVGDLAERSVDNARRTILKALGCRDGRLIFTSGATEAINLGLQGFARRAHRLGRRARIAVSPVEHSAVLQTVRALQEQGLVEVTMLRVDSAARLDLTHLHEAASRGLDVVAVMGANNEVGTINPIREIGEIVERAGALLFCDATQSVGKLHFSFDEARISLLACSAHKLYGPKGIGALVLAPDVHIDAILFGGEQEVGIRPGTLNVPAIAAFGEACRIAFERLDTDALRISGLRNRLEATLIENISAIAVNGAPESRLSGNLHVSVLNIPNGAILARIREKVALATGAACSSGLESPSHVLRAMGLPQSYQDGALRIGLGRFTTEAEVSRGAEIICAAYFEACAANL